MKVKQRIKIMVDVFMSILLFILMAFHYTGRQWHEITGTVMLVFFILHHILNGNWYRTLGKGEYRSGRILLTTVDAILFIDMLLLMFSGIAISHYVFCFLDLPVSRAWGRGIHMIASYTGFMLMGFHLGLHYGMLMGTFKKIFNIQTRNAVRACVLRIIAVVIAAYGIYALYMRKFIDYILRKEMFAYFDYDEPIILFLLDYAAVMGLMIFIAYYLQRLLQGRKSHNMNT